MSQGDYIKLKKEMSLNKSRDKTIKTTTTSQEHTTCRVASVIYTEINVKPDLHRLSYRELNQVPLQEEIPENLYQIIFGMDYSINCY